ncbi:hypothetical protein ACTMTI_24465 [Nonomuraea sp. H19]|uniref:hypothetical protein n=1 Tax=Nonomuraea sp. H19 TaxID=3452206 RepID=UPI003F8BD3BA
MHTLLQQWGKSLITTPFTHVLSALSAPYRSVLRSTFIRHAWRGILEYHPLFVGLVCSSQRLPAVIRFQWNGSSYAAIGTSRQRPGCVVPSDGGGAIEAAFSCSAGYTGCPYCGADNFVRCGRCHGLNCHDNSWTAFHCPRCENSGTTSGTIDSLSGLGKS